MRQRRANFKVLKRAATVMAVLGMVVGGVTFAALQSQQDTLTGNTIETATAGLLLSTDGSTYGTSHAGFDFNNIIPGGPAVPAAGYPFYLKNTGGTPLGLRIAVSSVPTNPNHIDLSQVLIALTTVGNGGQTFSLQQLIDANNAGGVLISDNSLPSATSQQYKLQVSMGANAVSGNSASLGNIDFAFSGTAQSN